MLPAESCMVFVMWDMLPGFDLYNTDPAQHVIAAGLDPRDVDYLDGHLSEMWKVGDGNRGVRTVGLHPFCSFPNNLRCFLHCVSLSGFSPSDLCLFMIRKKSKYATCIT